MFFNFFFIIDLYFVIPTAIAEIFDTTTELMMPKVIKKKQNKQNQKLKNIQ